MSTKTMPLLLCTNGAVTTRPALAYGEWLAGVLKAKVVVLGIVEAPEHEQIVESLLDETARRLEAAAIAYQCRLLVGHAVEVICQQAQEAEYLTIVGPLGRPLWRRLAQGSSFRQLLASLATPLLYVPAARIPLKHLLICTGGLQYTSSLEHLGIYLAQATGARITLLHVVEPVTLDYPLAREIHAHWQTLLETDTPQARNLRQAFKKAQEAGLSVTVKMRHGNTVHEIQEEVRTGDYDLVGMGSPYSAHSLRRLFLPNVTAEVAEAVNCPVLAVRYDMDREHLSQPELA